MDGPTTILEANLEVLGAAWADALREGVPTTATGATTDAPFDAQLRSMSDAGLVRATEAAGKLGRSVNAIIASLAGEVARRSPRDSGAESLAKRHGYRNPVQLVANTTGGAFAGAAKLIEVGRVTATRTSVIGEALPPHHPHVAGALRAGSVSVDAAAAITGMLERIALRVDPADAARCERLLAQRAAALPLELLNRAIAEVEARLDPDGVQPQEGESRAARSLTVRQDSRGLVRISGALDPETGAPVLAAIQGIVTHALRAARDNRGGDGDTGAHDGERTSGASPISAVADGRSIPQLQADALSTICRHALGCRRLPEAPAASVVVRIDLDTLTGAVGHAQIDGMTRPVSAGTARRMAAAAGIIPIVFDGDSLPLDVGRAARGFTPAQRIALAERDGGCACCGLDIAYTEAHHIRWWARDNGRTDLSNGVLLCQACHIRVHTDGWIITADRNRVWFTPPACIDRDRTPRLGGKARYQVVDDALGAAREPHALAEETAEPTGPPANEAPDRAQGSNCPERVETDRSPHRNAIHTPPPTPTVTARGTRRRSRVRFRE